VSRVKRGTERLVSNTSHQSVSRVLFSRRDGATGGQAPTRWRHGAVTVLSRCCHGAVTVLSRCEASVLKLGLRDSDGHVIICIRRPAAQG